jgi:hypothetical protein
MKPEGVLQGQIACDLSEWAFYDALENLGVILPEITLTINPKAFFSHLADFNPKQVRVRVLFDETYDYDEWSVSANDKIYWSSGA